MFPHWYPVHHDDDGTRFLAIWQRHVQGNDFKNLFIITARYQVK